MISQEFWSVLRSEPHVHDVDGACQLCFVIKYWSETLNWDRIEFLLRLADTRMTTERQHTVELIKVIARGQGLAGKKADKHVTSQPRILKKAKRYPLAVTTRAFR